MPHLRSAALSDIGKIRFRNEDRFICNDTLRLYGVADGIGGLPGGEQAAQLTVEEIERGWQHAPTKGAPDLATLVRQANRAVTALGRTLSPGMGIGTTLTFGAIRDRTLHLAHVGDSRCYVWFKGAFELLTRDHSVESDAQFLRARGEVVHYHESNRNALTRCVGQPGEPEVDVSTRPLRAGERYLFCTDGVTRPLREAEIAETIGRNDDPAEALREIITLANQRGGPDNCTAVLVSVESE